MLGAASVKARERRSEADPGDREESRRMVVMGYIV